MPRTIVDIHVLQTVPPSNINRDDTGSPKSAMYGGRRRARVSSQAWKRATRDAFEDVLDRDELGVRTKRVVELLGEEIVEQARELEVSAAQLAEGVINAAGIKTKAARKKEEPNESGYLLFLSRRQIESLAELAIITARGSGEEKPNFNTSEIKGEAKRRAKQDHSVDVALFGRMVADVTDLNVDAAVQVAHALSVHAVDNEFDYFTAVDDHKKDDADEDAGAAMIGTVEFNSSTMYRYATLDVDRLQGNLGNADVCRRAVEAFVRAFVSSMPTGKQNTFANRTLPDAVLIVVRDTQSINLVGAFEEPVDGRGTGSRVTVAAERLAAQGAEVHQAYGQEPVRSWWFGLERAACLDRLASRSTFDATVGELGTLVGQRLPEQQ